LAGFKLTLCVYLIHTQTLRRKVKRDAISRKHHSQLEINDLIAEAVVNGEARRHEAIAAAEESLSDEEAAAVKGGLSTIKPIIPPIVMGLIYIPPSPIFLLCYKL